MTETLGSRIKAARKAAGVTQQEAAVRARMSIRGVSDLEQGTRTDPHYSTLLKLARALGVDPHWLYTGEGSATAGKAEAPSESPSPETGAGPEEPGPRELYESHLKTTLIGHADTLITRGEDVVNDLKTSKGDLPLVQVADFGYATWALRGVLDKQVPAVKQDPDVRETMEELEAVERQVNPLLTPWFGPNPLKPAEWETRGLFVDRLAENQAEANAEPEERAAEPGA